MVILIEISSVLQLNHNYFGAKKKNYNYFNTLQSSNFHHKELETIPYKL